MAFGKLEIKYPNGSTSVVELTKRQMVLGRASDADVPINDNQVSRRHALLLCSPEGVRLIDAGSANGTFLSGAKLPSQQPIPLPDGAQIRVGQTMIQFVAAKPDEVAKEVAKESTAVREAPSSPQIESEAPETPKPAAAEAIAAEPDETSARQRAPKFEPPPPEGPGGPVAEATPGPEPARLPGSLLGVPTDQSSYLRYLPAVFSANEFLGRFLLIFENVLTPIDHTIDNLHYYFDPRMTPPDFLPWLASWLGLVLDERWPEGQRRELIRSAGGLYEWRGTRRGLAEFVRLYTGHTPEIIEPGVGKKKVADGEAFRFVVRIKVPDPNQVDREMLQSIIDMEKPAHAGYTLEVSSET